MAKRFTTWPINGKNEFDERGNQVGDDFGPTSIPSQQLPLWAKALIWAISVLYFFGLVIDSFF